MTPPRMTPGERQIYATAFAFAWGTRYEEAAKTLAPLRATATSIDLPKLACESASAAAAAVRVFRMAAAHMPPGDPARPYLDDMLRGLIPDDGQLSHARLGEIERRLGIDGP
jgi:hypothetical protein